MAFRIHDSVVRGEIDNRIRGIVRGKIWVEGRAEPIALELKGNAWPDLAGCLLKFTNPKRCSPRRQLASLHALQRGTIGDLTASRKVRVFDIPTEEAYLMCKRGEKPTAHIANCLYLEWFSDHNGRVVIESTDYILDISAPEWRLSPEEDLDRARLASEGMERFTHGLTEAIEKHQHGQKDPEDEWDEHDYEKLLKESDARADKYLELLEKYGDSDEAQEKIAREMGWRRELSEEDAEEQGQRIEEMNNFSEGASEQPEPDAHREGIDWIQTKNGCIAHPLQHRCNESALKFRRRARKAGMEQLADNDLDQFVFEFQTTSAKLAGALNGVAQGRGYADHALIVACLKRALNHLHKALAGLEAVAPKKILTARTIADARKEVFGIRQEILALMDQFRGRKNG